MAWKRSSVRLRYSPQNKLKSCFPPRKQLFSCLVIRLNKTPTLHKLLAKLIDFLAIRSSNPDYYVFGSEGKPGPVPGGKNHFYHRHSKILAELGIIGKYTVYGWKHTGNIKAIRLGIHAKKLQLQNGFTEYRTMEIYTRRLAAFTDDEIYEKFV